MDFEKKYTCKDVPEIKISLMENNEIVFSFENEYVIDYNYHYGTDEDMLCITLCALNPAVYHTLISKIYDKYIIEETTFWRNQENGKSEVFESPSKIFTNFSIQNNLDGVNFTQWELKFWNDN